LRHPDHRADPDELPAGRAERAVRIDDRGRRLGLADVPLAGAAAGEAGRGHRGHLRRAAGMERLPVPAGAHAELRDAGAAAVAVAYQGEFTVNIPAVLAAVMLSALPILVLYIVGRRQ